jgi:hypothetical protein
VEARLMDKQSRFKVGWKVFFFWAIFLILYGAYKFFPVFPLSIICGTDESLFQHLKVTFFTLLILNGIEYLIFRKQISNPSEFWYVRLLVATFSPWMVFLLWYLSPAIYGARMPSTSLEIVYSNVITILVGFYTVTFERNFGQTKFSPMLKFITISLLCISILLYMIFTFSHLPWADVFIEATWN